MAPKTAEIIAVGSELLTPQRVDTNSLYITEQLNLLGVEVVSKHVIGDDRERLTNAIKTITARTNIVIVSGGLGPTEDDVTRDAAAAALGRKLVLDLHQESVLIQRFRQINRPMSANNIRQAHVLEDAEVLVNPVGTAPGQFISTDKGCVALLPGPPRELKPMFTDQLLPKLRHIVPPQVIRTRTFRITGMGESELDNLIAPIYTKYTNPTTTILFAIGDLSVTLRAQTDTEDEADRLLREVGNPICETLGDRIYSEDPNESLDMLVGKLLRQHRATVAVAESCTGGLLAGRLTDAPGSSDYFLGGFVTYTGRMKQEQLGIPHELIQQHSAVSKQVATAMAENARARTGATYGLSVTGYAGPTGGTEYDPVGTVYLGLAAPHGTTVTRYRHMIGRDRIRALAAQNALDLLRKDLLARP